MVEDYQVLLRGLNVEKTMYFCSLLSSFVNFLFFGITKLER